MKKEKRPWFIWLSLMGIPRIQQQIYKRIHPMKTDWQVNTWAGYCLRAWGLMLGVVMLPAALTLCVLNSMSEPYATIWTCIIILYVYFAGVFVLDRLYRYWEKALEEYENNEKSKQQS